MSANRIFLVCQHHPEPENALCLAERADANAQYSSSMPRKADDWFLRHAKCGNPDDFQLAYGRPQNWDVSPPAEDTVAGGVRIALMNGSGREQ